MSQNFPPVRLVALDLDGTLLNHSGEITPLTREAIARATANGRPLASLPPVVAQLPGIRYALTSNGAAVWDLGSDPLGAVYSRYANAAERQTSEPACLMRRLMPVETAREVFARFQQYDGELSAVHQDSGGHCKAGSPPCAFPFHRSKAEHPGRPVHGRAGPRKLDGPPRRRTRKALHVL